LAKYIHTYGTSPNLAKHTYGKSPKLAKYIHTYGISPNLAKYTYGKSPEMAKIHTLMEYLQIWLNKNMEIAKIG